MLKETRVGLPHIVLPGATSSDRKEKRPSRWPPLCSALFSLVPGMQGVPERKLCPGRDRLPLCTPRRQHHDRHKRQHRNRLYGLHKGALHEGEMQIFSPSCTLAGQNQSSAAPSQPSCGGRPGSRGRGHSHGKCGRPPPAPPPSWSPRGGGASALGLDARRSRDAWRAAIPAAPLPKFCCCFSPSCSVCSPFLFLLQHNK